MSDLVKTKTVNLDKARKLRFNFKTIMLFEKETGQNFFAMEKGLSATDILTLLWACLTSAGEEITKEELADMVDFGNIGGISKAIEELTAAAMPEMKKKENNCEGSGTSGNKREGRSPLGEKLQSS